MIYRSPLPDVEIPRSPGPPLAEQVPVGPVAQVWDRDAFGALLAGDVIYRGPQTREHVRGRNPCIRFDAEGFPHDWHITVQRIVAEGQHAPAGSSSPGNRAHSPACASWISETTARSP